MVSLPSSLDLKELFCFSRKSGIPDWSPGVSHHPGCMELNATLMFLPLYRAAHRSVSVTCARFANA